MAFKLDSKVPAGELAQKWSNHKAAIKVVSPAKINANVSGAKILIAIGN